MNLLTFLGFIILIDSTSISNLLKWIFSLFFKESFNAWINLGLGDEIINFFIESSSKSETGKMFEKLKNLNPFTLCNSEKIGLSLIKE